MRTERDSGMCRTISLRVQLILFVCLAALAIPSAALAERIAEIDVRGNRLIEDGTVLLQLSSKVGDTLDERKVASDIKSVYRTGFFDDVTARQENTSTGVRLIFDVRERPAIRNVFLQGNDAVNDDTLKEKLNIGARRFLDRLKLNAGVREALKYYQGLGYYDAIIDFKEESVSDTQVDVTFQVTEGEKKVIREVVFQGNKQVSTDDIEDVVKTRTHNRLISWLSGWGILKRDQLEADAKEMQRLYLTKGFVDVKVADPQIEEIEDGLRVTFVVQEGEQYDFGKISATGTLFENSEAKTLEGIAAKSGETFNSDTLRNDTFVVSEKFTNVGYAFANVNPATRINRATRTVDVTYEIDKGNEITVNRISISGNRKTYDNVIRRSLTIGEREQYSSSKIKRSQELIQRLGYFNEVTISPERTDNPNEVDLNVGVKEGDTGTFSIGAGISSGDGFIVSSSISERNLFGTGNSITLDVNNGSVRRTYLLSFTNPRVNDSRWSFTTDAQSVEREFDAFDRQETSGGFGFGYPLWFLGSEYLDDVRLGLSYELARIKIDDLEDDAPPLVVRQQGETVSSSVTTRLIRNTIDNPLDPRKGSRQVLSVEVAGLGGDEEFWLGQVANTIYFPLVDTSAGPIVFSQRTRLGWGETFNDEEFPLFRRFFPGGINSVRGFDARELGPKDDNGNEFGGNKELVANFDFIFPLIPSIGLNGVLFYDAGEAFNDDDPIRVSELRQAVGYGIRWRSPLAPIRIEIGYPLDKEEGEGVTTNFSFGSPQ